MKISTLNTTSFANFVSTASDNIANIMQDENILALFNSEEKKNPLQWVMSVAKILCGPCRQDVFAIIGALHGKTADEIANQNILVTVGMLRDIYEDIKTADIPE